MVIPCQNIIELFCWKGKHGIFSQAGSTKWTPQGPPLCCGAEAKWLFRGSMRSLHVLPPHWPQRPGSLQQPQGQAVPDKKGIEKKKHPSRTRIFFVSGFIPNKMSNRVVDLWFPPKRLWFHPACGMVYQPVHQIPKSLFMPAAAKWMLSKN